jgi:hypothetical protein
MSRRRQATKRPLLEDAKFHSTLVSRMVNTVMMHGKKTVAQRIVHGAFDEIAAKSRPCIGNSGRRPYETNEETDTCYGDGISD